MPSRTLLALRHLRHGKRLVGHGQVIENRFLIHVHALDAILNDDGNFISECRIVGQQVRNGQREHVAVAVLMLQAFAGQRGSSRRSADEESAAAHVRRSPDQIPDALEAEHRVINKEREWY